MAQGGGAIARADMCSLVCVVWTPSGVFGSSARRMRCTGHASCPPPPPDVHTAGDAQAGVPIVATVPFGAPRSRGRVPSQRGADTARLSTGPRSSEAPPPPAPMREHPRGRAAVGVASAPFGTSAVFLGSGGGTSREGEKDIWWTAGITCGGTGHLGLTHTETQRGRLWTACGQRRVDSKNSQTTPATTSTSSIRQLLGAADAQ